MIRLRQKHKRSSHHDAPRCRYYLFSVRDHADERIASPLRATRKEKTIESLEDQTVEVRPGKVIIHSTELARDNYKAFLELSTEDPDQRAEAMRRLGDLELDATEEAQLSGKYRHAE